MRDPDVYRTLSISIHALLAESDVDFFFDLSLNYFYPRSPCGERHPSVMQEIAQQRISIHALLAESDSPEYFLT